MKKILSILAALLAINFLAVAGGAGWLWKSGHLNRDRFVEIKKVMFPPPATQPAEATTQPAAAPTLRLDDLLAHQAGLSASEKVEFIQRAVDAQMAQLDRRQRELADLQRQVEEARQKLTEQRTAFEAERQALDTRKQQAAAQENDQGFQEALTLLQQLSSKQAKQILLTKDDETIARLLQALEPRMAGKIIKEFKTVEEQDRIARVFDKIRQPGGPPPPEIAPPIALPQASSIQPGK